MPEIELAWGEHRGAPQRFLHSSAYGQWGEVMLEFVQQDEEGPSPFRDMYPQGKEGIHHMAAMVDSMDTAYAHYADQGYVVAARAATLTGTEFAFIDTVEDLGHMIEIYERSPGLLGFYEKVKNASREWRGEDPIRSIA